MNHVLCRLWSHFVEHGGDFTNGSQVNGFIQWLENRKLTLSPRRRWAFELVLRAPEAHPYPRLVAELKSHGVETSERTLRRLVQRAISDIEAAMHAHRWDDVAMERRRPPPQREVNDEAA
jgi:hypothetical protein